MIGLSRILVLLYHYFSILKYNSDVASWSCRINGFNKNIIFGIKCYFKKYPFQMIGIIFLLFIITFSMSIWLSEY